MLTYDPKDAVLLWPAGNYLATLTAVEETRSKAGNDMYKLTFTVWHGEKQMTLTEYVVIPSFVWKLKRLAKALGSDAFTAFEAGGFDPSRFIGDNVGVTLAIQKQDGFDDKNQIAAYLWKGDVQATPSLPPEESNELPF